MRFDSWSQILEPESDHVEVYKLYIDIDNVRTEPLELFAIFDITIAIELDFTVYTNINAIYRIANRHFYAAGLHGLYIYPRI